MPRWTDTVMIDGKPVEVVINTPGRVSVLNLQDLAEKALRSVNEEITVGQVTVKVQAFSS